MSFFDYFTLSKPCDACGSMVGGGAKWCPKCKICFCHLCHFDLLMQQRKKYLKNCKLVCPMWGPEIITTSR